MAFVANWRSHEVTLWRSDAYSYFIIKYWARNFHPFCIFAIDLNARKVYTTRCHVNWFKKYLKVWKNKIRLKKSLGLKLRSKNFILYPLMHSFFILEIFFTIRFLESWLNLVQPVLGGGLRVCFWPLGVALSTWRNSRTGLSITPHPNLNW